MLLKQLNSLLVIRHPSKILVNFCSTLFLPQPSNHTEPTKLHNASRQQARMSIISYSIAKNHTNNLIIEMIISLNHHTTLKLFNNTKQGDGNFIYLEEKNRYRDTFKGYRRTIETLYSPLNFLILKILCIINLDQTFTRKLIRTLLCEKEIIYFLMEEKSTFIKLLKCLTDSPLLIAFHDIEISMRICCCIAVSNSSGE
ncbi:hypothetical protein AGLY_014433 [Aphis glycines]|uniref:Uncharacterized protein n=1 Tax=Aphis glycines TaxID=307491 RepID=A0A6G0T3P0_APHGL|nr:hypothetical protein AGLY_014433 [Aphis glycines]